MKRVIVYVDGFNMFHSIKHRYGKQFYRLNYKKLASDFLEYEDKIVETKYFTALFPNDNDGVARHKQYIKALYSIGVKTILGEFQKVKKKFGNKNPIIGILPKKLATYIYTLLEEKAHMSIDFETYEEKKTDVNIALNIVIDAYKDVYDKAIIITGDNDISPALIKVKEAFKNKELVVIFPMGGKGKSLKKVCDKSFVLQKTNLQHSLLTDPTNGITKPEERY